MKTWKSLKEDLLRNDRVRTEYERLEPEYQLIDSLIQARIKRGLTQEALARKIGTRQSAISRLERGIANPSLSFLKRVAAGLGCQIRVRFEL